MELFEALFGRNRSALSGLYCWIDSPADTEDILQETYLTAYQKFSQLRNPDAFKAWVLSIARNKCTDYFRQKALRQETSFEALAESADSRYGASGFSLSGKPSTHSGKRTVNSAFLLLGGADSGGDCEKAGNPYWNCEKTFHSETEFQKAISIFSRQRKEQHP